MLLAVIKHFKVFTISAVFPVVERVIIGGDIDISGVILLG